MAAVADFTKQWDARRHLDAGGDALLPAREAAIRRFAALGLPTPRHEDWKYTSLSALKDAAFEPVSPAGGPRETPGSPGSRSPAKTRSTCSTPRLPTSAP